MKKNFIISAAIFFGMCLIYFFIMISKTEGNFTYLLDDAYIHLAIAKNFALYDVWGMTPHAFSSSSSSPVFTFLIAMCIKVFGNSALIPLAINLVCAVGIIYVLAKYYSRFSNKTIFVVSAVLVTVFSAALHLQLFSGMEHLLQVFLVILNIYFLTDWLQGYFKNSKPLFFFYSTLLLLGLVRFEMMFYFVSLAFFLILIKKLQESFLVLFFGFVPIFIFCYFNYQQTGYLFPNSVVVKGTAIDFSGNVIMQVGNVLLSAFENRSFYKRCLLPLLLLIAVLIIDYRNRKSLKEFLLNNFLLLAWGTTMLLHSVFADLKSILRYEAYLMVAFAMLILPRLTTYFENFRKVCKKNLILTLLIAGNVLLVISKMAFSNKILCYGSKNIYEQQVQAGKFLHAYYNDSKIVANDIGAMSYFTEIYLFDIVGLGSPQVMEFKQKPNYSQDDLGFFVDAYTKTHHYDIAIVYKEWLRGFVPKDWEEVAVLSIESNAVVSQPDVTIYCINPAIKESLKNNIKKFNWSKNVKVKVIE